MDQQNKPSRNIEEVQEIDLLDLFGYYLSRLPLLIAAVIIGALIAGLFTHFLIPEKFTATSRMYMVSSSSDSVVDLSDLNIGASLSNDYVELMKSRPVIEDVIEKQKLDYTYEQVLGMISLSVVSNTRIVKISVTSTDPKEAMEIANQMARTSKRLLPIVMDAPSPTIAEDAVMPTHKSSPSLSSAGASVSGASSFVVSASSFVSESSFVVSAFALSVASLPYSEGIFCAVHAKSETLITSTRIKASTFFIMIEILRFGFFDVLIIPLMKSPKNRKADAIYIKNKPVRIRGCIFRLNWLTFRIPVFLRYGMMFAGIKL